MIKKILVQLVFLFCFFEGFAQIQKSIPNVMYPSPTAMQFQRYGDYPVNYYTGVPSISLPIYTINEGDIQVPITLNYHASGCRPDDVSGFTGLGWTLDVGGMLTRTVNGLPDEGGSPFMIPTQTAQNINSVTQSELLHQLESGYYDHEFDTWNFNFLGNSGSYIINPATGQKFAIENKSNINLNHSSGEIYDSYGKKYLFGTNGGVESTTYTDPISLVSKSAVTAMPLSLIKSGIDPANTVSYTYQPGPHFFQSRWSNQYIRDDSWNGCASYFADNFPYTMSNSGGVNNAAYQENVQTYYPKEITFRSGKIKFNQDAVTLMLSSIEVYNINNEIVKKIAFNITPFPSAYPVNTTSNFKLQSVSYKDNLNNTVETYSFNYYNETISDAKPLPYTASSGKDYWGFYNGDNGRSSRIPDFTGFATNAGCGSPSYGTIGGGAILTPSEEYTKEYILNKISYPTGGYTEFEFEGNRDKDNVLAGGLRIKAIKNFASNNQLSTQKSYSYTSFLPREITPSSSYYVTEKRPYFGNSVFARRIYMSENPSVSFSPKGSPIGYDIVTETDNNGSTVFHYDNGAAYSYEQMNYPATEYLNSLPSQQHFNKQYTNNYKPWNYGNLISKETNNTSGNTITAEGYEYEEYITGTLRDFLIDRWISPECLLNMTPAYSCSQITCGGPGNPQFDICFGSAGYNVFNYADRYHPGGGKRIKKKIDTYTDNGRTVSTTIEYFYENSLKPTVATKTITTNSRGETITTYLKYPYDYPATSPYDEMVNRNMLAPVIQQTIANTTLNKELSKTMVNYGYWQTNTIIQPAAIQKSILGNTLETEAAINAYDNKGNMLQATDKDGVITSYLYGYNQQYPVAKVINKSYSDAISQSGINLGIINNTVTTDAVMRTELNKLRSLTGALVSTYTYKPLVGITSETDPNGKTIYYEYDAFNRLTLIRDKDNNILKKICYNYAGQPETCVASTAANWQQTGITRCKPCAANASYSINMQQHQEKDANVLSATYNTVRWIDDNIPGNCSITADWQITTTAQRCQVDAQGANTGYQEQEYRDMNPCSATYNTTTWLRSLYNTGACPLPVVTSTVPVTVNNLAYAGSLTATFTNVNTGAVSSFTIPQSSGLTNIGTLPAGTYNLSIAGSGGGFSLFYLFSYDTQYVSGTSATFNNISAGSTITIESGD